MTPSWYCATTVIAAVAEAASAADWVSQLMPRQSSATPVGVSGRLSSEHESTRVC